MLHLLAQIAQTQVAQAAADPVTDAVTNTIGAGGGAIGLLVGAFLMLDRLGYLKRNGNGNGKDAISEAREQRVVQHEQRVVMLLESIAKSLEKLTDNSERDTREILSSLASLNHRGE